MSVQINKEDFAKPWRPGIYPKSTTVIYNNQLWILNDAITGLFSSSDFLAEVANGDWIGRYATEGDLSTKEDVVNKATDFSIINDTLYPTIEAVKEQLDLKQNTLISGTNIKTINGNSILGSGNLVISNKKSIEYNTTTLCVYNFPATSNWTYQGGSFGMGAYGSARSDSGYSNFLTLITLAGFTKVIGGIAPFNMKLTSNCSFVTPEPNLVGGDLKLIVGYVEFNYATGAINNATLVDAGTYTPATGGRVDLREDFGGEITIPKGAIWSYSWAHTKTSAVTAYLQTILNFEEV